jgi:hypothetical protein
MGAGLRRFGLVIGDNVESSWPKPSWLIRFVVMTQEPMSAYPKICSPEVWVSTRRLVAVGTQMTLAWF